jgi:hypothetical protein
MVVVVRGDGAAPPFLRLQLLVRPICGAQQHVCVTLLRSAPAPQTHAPQPGQLCKSNLSALDPFPEPPAIRLNDAGPFRRAVLLHPKRVAPFGFSIHKNPAIIKSLAIIVPQIYYNHLSTSLVKRAPHDPRAVCPRTLIPDPRAERTINSRRRRSLDFAREWSRIAKRPLKAARLGVYFHLGQACPRLSLRGAVNSMPCMGLRKSTPGRSP